MENKIADPLIRDVFSRFFSGVPVRAETVDTSRGDSDFRKTVIVTTDAGDRAVLKMAANDFTFPDKIRMWQRTAEEYRKLGYYCPRILSDRNGGFPTVTVEGRTCVAYAEEFSRFRSLEDRAAEGGGPGADSSAYAEDIWTMTAKIAAKRLDYTDYPSAYCLFETFCPSDTADEVTENALAWKQAADALPEEFSARAQRIWARWCANKAALRTVYGRLPTSVFQADLNATNLLIDETGAFRGLMDFNLCGKDVFLNYLMRENYDAFEKEIGMIRAALRIASRHYAFSAEEKRAALPLYRCLKPLWYNRVEALGAAGNDRERIRRCLDQVEYYQTADIDFVSDMG